MKDTSHLVSLIARITRERGYLAGARTAQERELRTIWISQLAKEIALEEKFLGMDATGAEMTDAELLAELRS